MHSRNFVVLQVLTWAPQNDVLGHPRVRVFLSHCGANSMYEVWRRRLCAYHAHHSVWLKTDNCSLCLLQTGGLSHLTSCELGAAVKEAHAFV